MKNKGICLESVKNNVIGLCLIPKKYIDREICLEAVKSRYGATLWIPEDIEIYMEALRNLTLSIKNMKDDEETLTSIQDKENVLYCIMRKLKSFI